MMKKLPILIAMSSVILLGGCSTINSVRNDTKANVDSKEAELETLFVQDFPELDINTLAEQSGVDTFKFGDTVEVTFYNIDSLSGAYVVDRNGTIDFPLIGSVKVLGMNTAFLQSKLEERYGERYLQNPSIAVKVEPVLLGKVVVDGAVDEPGVFEVFDVIKLSEAIALAGGTTIDADTKELYIVRNVAGERKVKRVNLKELREQGTKDPDIYPNDIIFVQNNNVRIAYNEFLRTVPLISAILLASTR